MTSWLLKGLQLQNQLQTTANYFLNSPISCSAAVVRSESWRDLFTLNGHDGYSAHYSGVASWLARGGLKLVVDHNKKFVVDLIKKSTTSFYLTA